MAYKCQVCSSRATLPVSDIDQIATCINACKDIKLRRHYTDKIWVGSYLTTSKKKATKIEMKWEIKQQDEEIEN